MKKTVVIFLHLGYWLMYLLLLTIVFAAVSIQFKKNPNIYLLFPLFILYLAPNFISFYLSYFWLFPKFLVRKKFFALIIFGVAACFISALSTGLISIVFYGFNQPIFNETNEFIGFTVSLTLIAAVHAVIALIIRGFITWYNEIKLKEELTQKNYEMELALIKSQINPHFLFNTINNIDVLIAKDALKASEYLNKLSDILRYMVYDTKAEKILLEKEILYIEKYIELQKIRTSNPNYVHFEVTGKTNNLTIAPMIFFPFIENAFKHTESNKNLNKINIKILIEKNKIFFECVNTYQQSSMQSDYGGLGNELIGKRLTLLYPAAHLMETIDNNDFYRVKLMLDTCE